MLSYAPRALWAFRSFLLLASFAMGCAGSVAAAASNLSLMLLPPIGGAGSPQLAISWKGEQAGQLELSVLAGDGKRRALKTRALEPGMHLDGVELAASDQKLLAVLRDAQGRELARAESAAQAGAPQLDVQAPVPANSARTDRAKSAPRPKGSTLDWKATFTGNDGPSSDVSAMTIYDDGTGPALVIGGDFTTASGLVVNRIARWNGSAWSALGTGMNDTVSALTVYNGALIAGGKFTLAGGVANTARIAHWNGSAWSALGTGMNDTVSALTVYNGELIAGGRFSLAGGIANTRRIARWNGSAWSALGTGMSGTGFFSVAALTVYNGELIAGGDFTLASGIANTVRIARWNGSAWSALGTGMNGTVAALTVYNGELIAGGSFTLASGIANTVRIARWNGSAWSALGTGMNGTVSALTVYNGALIAGGSFSLAGGVPDTTGIARWNGSAWSALGTGMNDTVSALTAHNGELIAGGAFSTAGGVQSNFIARWNSSTWSTLATGTNIVGRVDALAEYNGDLIAGGFFRTAGGVTVNGIARWNGSAWMTLGTGTTGSVRALTVHDGALIAGGNFLSAGGVPSTRNIARWDGIEWSALGTGMDSGVRALTVYNSKLIAGGNFTVAGGVNADYIALWDGSMWSELGGGMGQDVYAFAVLNGQLIAGGRFLAAGGTSAQYIASWNGSVWSALGTGLGDYVDALAVYNGELIAGGTFFAAGGVSANGIARWNGSAWSALGTGLNSVSSLIVYNGELIAGGCLTTCIARWDGSGWSALGSGTNRVPLALTIYNGELIAGGDFTAAGSAAVPYIAAYGVADLTVTEVTSTHPTPSRAGEPVRIRARVIASTAPTVGHVTITGAPGGSCSDLTLTPISATTSEAECTIRWSTAGARTLTATYIGGRDWMPSNSAAYVHTVDPATDSWRHMFVNADTGLNGAVRAATIWDDGSGPALVIGGDFTTAGGAVVNRVARWNGSAWSALGSGAGNGVDSLVFALAVSGGDLYVGGQFTQTNVGGTVVPANRIARWNGIAWSALGSGAGNGVSDQVNALAVSGSDLYVGGIFAQANVGGTVVAANRIARWDGGEWSALASGGGNGVNNVVHALAVSGGSLYVGGQFTQANVGGAEVSANRIARWTGGAWSALGSGSGNGVSNRVLALAVSGSDLYVGGGFTTANVGGTEVLADNIARWNGIEWSALGGGNGVNGGVVALAVSGSDLYVGGFFTQANVGGTVVSANRIARWSGSAWSAIGSGGNGVDNVVNALAVSGGDLYVGGSFFQANIGGTVLPANRMARWNGSTWSALGSSGLNGSVRALAIYGGELIAAGDFTTAGGLFVNRVARWNGSAWSALGSGSGNGLNSNVNAMAVSGNDLYVGGDFTQANVGGTVVPANRIARWNGSAWSSLGSGGNGVSGSVLAVAVSGGDLYVGGIFTQANVGGLEVTANSIARWNGSAWSALGTSGGNGLSNPVNALAVFRNDLYVGGSFTQANVGGLEVTAWYVARWDGSQWQSLGSVGLNGTVNALAVSGGDLYVGGQFTQANVGGTLVPANNIARWNGGTWSALGSGGGNGVGFRVIALAVSGSDLYVGGSFSQANVDGTVVAANRIARWNGSAWSALGSGGGNGMDGVVNAIAVSGSDLYVGGDFTEANAGGTVVAANRIADWGPTTSTTTTVHSTTPNPSLPGQPVTLTARVSGRVAPTPGSVTFIGAPSGSCSDLTLTVLNDTTSEASCTVTFSVGGAQQITARYDGAALPGDFGHLPSVSSAFNHVVGQSTTSAITSIAPTPSTVGSSVTIDANVTGSSTRPLDGLVTVTASTGETCVDSTPSDGGGAISQFSCAISFATAGPRSLTAAFSASTVHVGSSSAAAPHAVVAVIAVSPISLPGGVFGVSYSQTVSASGAGSTPPYTYSISSGTLPGGLALDGPSGALSGSPNATGTFNFEITATDSSTAGVGGPFSGTRAYSVTIAQANQATLIATASPSTIGFATTSTLGTTGGSGTGGVTYAVTAGGTFCSVTGTTLTGTGVGTCTVTATKAADANYTAATATVDVTVVQATQATLTTSASPASIAFNETSTLSTSGGSGTGAVSYAVTAGGTFCSVTGATLTGTGVGTCTVTATKAADANYNAATATADVTVVQATQATLTASASPASIAFDQTSTLSTNGGSGTGAVTYAVTAGASFCEVTGTTLTGIGVGTCTVTATKAADTNYNAATSTVDITVVQATQATLTASASPASIAFDQTSTLSTNGGSGTGTVTYAVTAGASFCEVTGTTLTGTGVGACTVTATKAADANYNAATATVDVTVVQATQAALTASASPSSIAFDATSALSTSGGSGSGAVTFAVTAGGTFCSVTGATLTGTGVGTCTVTATKAADVNYNAATATVDVTVVQATQATLIASASPASIAFNGSSTLSTTGGSGNGAVSFAVTAGGSFCSVTGATLTGTGVGTCTVTATKAADTNYTATTATVDVTVIQATQTTLTTSASPSSIAFNGTSALSTTGGSGTGAVTYAVTVGGSFCDISASTLTGVGVGTCTVTATKAADANYTAATATVDVTVVQAAQATLTASASPSSIAFSDTSTLSTSGGSGTGAVTYGVTAGASFCSMTGTTLTGTGVGTCTVTATKPADANYTAATATVDVTVVQATQATLTASASPSSIAFNATSALSTSGGSGTGAVTYSVTTGASFCSVTGATLTGTGVGTCTVTATKAADANYTTATATVDVTVGQATQATLTASASPSSIAFGQTSTFSTTGGSGTGAVSYAVTTGASFCSVTGATLTGTGVGTCTVTATKAADTNYNATTGTVDVTVSQATQATLTASASPSSIAFDGTSTLSTNGGSGTGAVTFAVTAGASFCSVTGTSLTGTGVGTCTVTATKAADANYVAATAIVDVTVVQANQATLIVSASPASIAFNGTSTLSTSGGSGTGAVSYAVTIGASFCSVTGTTLTGTGVGTCTVTATKAADTNYNVATATVDVIVVQANQAALTASASPTSIAFAQTSTLGTTGGSGTGAVTFAVTAGGTFCSVTGTTLTGTGVGTCTVTATKAADANYNAATATVNVEVLAAADLEISKNDGRLYALPGGFVEYQILVGNAGPLAVQGARVQDPLPVGLANALWTCTPVQGTTCPAASGTGSINQLIDLPVNAVLRYVFSANVTAPLGNTITNTATVTIPNGTVETDAADNTSSDINTVVADGLFANGFETSSPLLSVPMREE